MRRLLACCVLAACGGTDVPPEPELVTRVSLTFGDGLVFVWDDPDGDGGEPPAIDPVVLEDGATYPLAVGFQNALEDPPEDITLEIADEADQHQVFFTGDAPLAHTYEDADANGLPVGLDNTVVATAGAGELTVTLCHLPPINDTPTKTAGLADGFDGCGAIPGETDARVTFPVMVTSAVRGRTP